MRDYYDVLGVPRDADQIEIKAAYRRRAQEVHPDREGGSTEAFQELQGAYSTLSDDDARAAYDAGGSGGMVTWLLEQAVAYGVSVCQRPMDDPLREARQFLLVKTKDLKSQVAQGQTRRAVYEALSRKVKRKGAGRNRFAELYAAALADFDAQIASKQTALEATIVAETMLVSFYEGPQEDSLASMEQRIRLEMNKGLRGG